MGMEGRKQNQQNLVTHQKLRMTPKYLRSRNKEYSFGPTKLQLSGENKWDVWSREESGLEIQTRESSPSLDSRGPGHR